MLRKIFFGRRLPSWPGGRDARFNDSISNNKSSIEASANLDTCAQRGGVVGQPQLIMNDRIHNLGDKKTLRQKLRRAPTRAERALWRALRRSALGNKFRRQHGVGRYVLDFYCPELKLAIELEGGVHRDEIRSELDEQRYVYLKEQGIRVLYFRNEVVYEYMDRVIETIRAAAEGKI